MNQTYRNPFVVQCKECRVIIADSFTLNTIERNYLIHSTSTLDMECEKIVVDDETHPFNSCIIRKVKCKCGDELGVFIESAGDIWNGCAGMFGFSKEKITSYMLGNATEGIRTMNELVEDIEKIKAVVAKIYRKIYQ